MTLSTSITEAFQYCDENGIPVPLDLHARARNVGAMKAASLAEINAPYHDAVTETLVTYFEGGSVTGPRNRFRQATASAFYDAFYLGWAEGGGGTPDKDGLSWLDARISQEYGYIDMLFQQVKELRKEEDFDFFAWVTARADGYTNTVREVYNAAAMRSSRDIMVTFTGSDGGESCPDCQKYKGQRHKVSWFVRRNAIPPFGTGLECHPGGRCRHYLADDKGNQVTA